MRALKIAAVIAAVVVVFAAGCLVFAPWEKIGSFALDQIRLKAIESGVYINIDGLSAVGGLSPRYTMRMVEVETSLAKATLHGVEVDIHALSSLASLGAVFDVSWSRGSLRAIPSIEISLSSGGASIKANRHAISLADVRLAGDMSMTGGCTFDLDTRKMMESTISFTVPEQLDQMMKNPILGRFVESDQDGRWRIKHDAQDRR